MAAVVVASMALLAGQSKGAWMKAANYDNLTTRQQHFDLGLSYAGTVVHTMWDTTWRGSGVVVNNPRCIVMSAHQFENAGAFLDPAIQNLFVRVGTNYLTNPGSSVRISQIIRHPTRTAPGVGLDVVIAILESDLPWAIPTTIATVQPSVNDVMDIVGFGNQGKSSISSWGYIIPTSGDIIGGKAPVYANDAATIETEFLANSSQPLIFNATPGDSGGGLFNAQRQLCGTLSQISTPSNSAGTYSVDLISIAPWIRGITAPYNLAPTLQIQKNGNQITLKAWNAPIATSAGNWVLDKGNILGDWLPAGVPFIGNTCVLSTSEPREFYRLRFVPTPQAALDWQAAQGRQVEAHLKAAPRIELPTTNNLMLRGSR